MIIILACCHYLSLPSAPISLRCLRALPARAYTRTWWPCSTSVDAGLRCSLSGTLPQSCLVGGASRCRTRLPAAVSSSTHLSNSAPPREVPSFAPTSFAGWCRAMPCRTLGGRSLCPIWGARRPRVRVQAIRQFGIARAPPCVAPALALRAWHAWPRPSRPSLRPALRADPRGEVRCWCATLTAIRYAAVPCHRGMSSCDRMARSWGRACWSSAINAASALHAHQLPDPSSAPRRHCGPRHRATVSSIRPATARPSPLIPTSPLCPHSSFPSHSRGGLCPLLACESVRTSPASSPFTPQKFCTAFCYQNVSAPPLTVP